MDLNQDSTHLDSSDFESMRRLLAKALLASYVMIARSTGENEPEDIPFKIAQPVAMAIPMLLAAINTGYDFGIDQLLDDVQKAVINIEKAKNLEPLQSAEGFAENMRGLIAAIAADMKTHTKNTTH